MEILEAGPQEYSTDSRSGITTPVGMEAEILRAKFVNVLSNVRLMDRIRQSFERAGIRIAEDELLISPLCLSRHLLTESERRAGCALVDIGAETTTVAVYMRDTLRHLVVLAFMDELQAYLRDNPQDIHQFLRAWQDSISQRLP